MFFEYQGEKYEAWIETTNDRQKLNEHNVDAKVAAGGVPDMECFAECVDGTVFAVYVKKVLPTPSHTDFRAHLHINGAQTYTYAWLKVDSFVCWRRSRGADGVESDLKFQAMEDCYDPEEQPKDLKTLSTIEVFLKPGSYTPSGKLQIANQPVTNPAQKAKPLHAKLASTVTSDGPRRASVADYTYTFTPQDRNANAPSIHLKWKYATRLKLVAKGVIDDPALKRQLKSPSPPPGPRRSKRKLEINDSGDEKPFKRIPNSKKDQYIEDLEKRLNHSEQSRMRLVQKRGEGSTAAKAIDLTDD